MKAKLIAIIILSNIISAGILSADSHEEAPTIEEELEKATRQWNQAANKGEWEKRFSYTAMGYTVFDIAGMLRSRNQNEESISNRIKNYTDWNNRGGDRSINLKDVRAKVHGDTAVVTAYCSGSVKQAEKDSIRVLSKVSVVWNKSEDGWKIVHVHWSKLQADWDD